MNSDNKQAIFGEDGECRIYCYICGNFCLEPFFKNHLKPQTHINIIRKREQINKSFQIISQY